MVVATCTGCAVLCYVWLDQRVWEVWEWEWQFRDSCGQTREAAGIWLSELCNSGSWEEADWVQDFDLFQDTGIMVSVDSNQNGRDGGQCSKERRGREWLNLINLSNRYLKSIVGNTRLFLEYPTVSTLRHFSQSFLVNLQKKWPWGISPRLLLAWKLHQGSKDTHSASTWSNY